ncbi:MAG: DUF1428 domain-containing protein [Patescibacteria group bacterium]
MAKNKTTDGKYVDGFVFVVSKKKLGEYIKMAQWGKELWMKHGALDYKECVGDDLQIKAMGGVKPLSFSKMAQAKAGETVCFSFIVFKSKQHRDSVNAKVMKDPVMNDPKYKDMPMPFDMRRMAYGGFQVMVDGGNKI